ncbi:hypothetical protein OF83DRAFT_1284923, partial [Amylostereum chailletii]
SSSSTVLLSFPLLPRPRSQHPSPSAPSFEKAPIPLPLPPRIHPLPLPFFLPQNPRSPPLFSTHVHDRPGHVAPPPAPLRLEPHHIQARPAPRPAPADGPPQVDAPGRPRRAPPQADLPLERDERRGVRPRRGRARAGAAAARPGGRGRRAAHRPRGPRRAP